MFRITRKITHSLIHSQLISKISRKCTFNFYFQSFMVVLCNRADHIYFHPVCLFYLLLLLFLFPRLIPAVGDWMSAILPHMVWP